MNSENQERPNLHIAPEKRNELFDLLQQAHQALVKASQLSRDLVNDDALCTNCRRDATQEETVINCAGALLESLRNKLKRELSGEMLQELLQETLRQKPIQ